MKWINVKNELPTDEVLCLLRGWDDMIYYRVLDYDFIHKEWSDWDGNLYNNVEYWMSLPKPPKK